MSTPRINQLKEILVLEQKREGLIRQLTAIDERLRELRRTMPAQIKTPSGKPGRKGRGVLRKQILDALEAAGPAGVRVMDLAREVNLKVTNLHAWFSIYTKKMPGLRRIAPGCYALKK